MRFFRFPKPLAYVFANLLICHAAREHQLKPRPKSIVDDQLEVILRSVAPSSFRLRFQDRIAGSLRPARDDPNTRAEWRVPPFCREGIAAASCQSSVSVARRIG